MATVTGGWPGAWAITTLVSWIIFSVSSASATAQTNNALRKEAVRADEASKKMILDAEKIKLRSLELTEQHISVLARKRLIGISQNEYGVVNQEKWRSDLEYFTNEVLLPALDAEWSHASIQFAFAHVALLNSIDERVEKAAMSGMSAYDISTAMDPYEFERKCAQVLHDHAWDASPTPGSGDQGADVIAKKNGSVLVLQCKLYSQPVGNKAVQEAIAAKAFYRADIAAVVTNSSFTKSALDLAKVAGVQLLTYQELVDEGVPILRERY